MGLPCLAFTAYERSIRHDASLTGHLSDLYRYICRQWLFFKDTQQITQSNIKRTPCVQARCLMPNGGTCVGIPRPLLIHAIWEKPKMHVQAINKPRVDIILPAQPGALHDKPPEDSMR